MKKEFPILYQMSSKNKLKLWHVWVEDGLVKELHGYKDGKLTPETIAVTKKNIGKTNETSLFEQACLEAQSKWNKKKDKGYTEEGEAQNTDVILPMLAEKYTKRKKDITFPAFLQPKLNGIRGVIHQDLRYQSRYGKFWSTLSHLNEDVRKILDSISGQVDGEVYIHGLHLQDIGALVKKERIDEDTIEGYKTEDLEYWIFDQICPGNFQARYSELHAAFIMSGAKIDKISISNFPILRLNKLVLVPIIPVSSHENIEILHKSYIAADFEGTMIRNNTDYVTIHRTANLQKYKNFMDAEFEIIGGKEGVGRDKGCITFRCKTDEGIEFDVKPMGTVAQRKRWFKDIDKLINKKLTCRFQEWTKEPKVPFHTRGITIREDYE